MMKFFRKYNKQLLAVFMVGLMVVFVGGSALQGLLTPDTNPVVATSRFGPITFVDQQIANETGKLLESLGFDWRHPAGWTAKPLETTDWILLRREARSLGVEATESSVRGTLSDPALDDRVNDLARRLRVRPEAMHTALADLRSIQQAASAIGGAAVPSEAELMVAARNALEAVSMRAVVLPAEMFVDDSLEFTEEEIKAQFERFRDKERGKGLNFGYYQPTALKVQYIEVDRQAIADGIKLANLDRKAKSYFEEKRTTDAAFARPNRNEPDPAATGKIEGPPAPPVDPYLTWDEAKDAAIEQVRKQHAEQAAARIADWIAQYTSESFIEVERNPDGYKPAPPAVARPEYYQEIVEKVPASIAYPDALSVRVTEFFAADQADKVPELGTARFQPERGMPQSFKEMVVRTQAIAPKVPTEEGSNASDYVSTGQTFPYPVSDATTGNLYMFRVLDSRASHVPTSVDEVRDQVIADLRLSRGYEMAKARAESLKQCMSYESLREAYMADLELADLKQKPGGATSGYYEPQPFSRVPRHMASRGRPAAGVFAGAGVGNLPNDVVDECFALEHADDKTRLLELPDRATVILAEWVETKPAPEDDFNTLRKQLVGQLADARAQSAIADWLDPDQVRARAGWKLGKE